MNTLPRDTGVFVIGGGPAGLATAIAARRHGFDVTVADCALPNIDKACGEGVMPDGQAAALALGIDLKAAGGHPFAGIRFVDGERTVEATFPAGTGLGLRRTALHRLLIEHAAAAGVLMCWGVPITGITRDGVIAGGRTVAARWIVGADGGHSRTRRWAGLDTCVHESVRFGFRRHFLIAPWSEFMELHWCDRCQFYVTPVSADEICVVLISRDPKLRCENALALFPALERRFAPARPTTAKRGAVTASRRLKAIYRDNVALVGDASGSVDAITGEGLCLLFQQAAALADALATGDLSQYQKTHQRIGRRQEWMASLMLQLDKRPTLRRGVMRAFEAQPAIFRNMLAIHLG
jgi:flavin-dependent dehydrogenase